ncbi:MAG: retroviral-like aspartic protease family protein, partial [Plesiomonas shigelloides]
MQINRFHLSPEERNRRINQRLCLYCGQPGHMRASCPSRPNPEKKKVVSLSIDSLNSEMCLTVPVNLHVNGQCVSTSALLDSGAAGNFMSHAFAQYHHITLLECPLSLTVEAIDGRPLGTGRISSITQNICMQTGLFHNETIQFYVLPTSVMTVILGLPWLRQHNPHISWKEGEIAQWSRKCQETCFVQNLSLPVRKVSVTDDDPERTLPEEYYDLAEAFSKTQASKLPPHRPYDCAIDLLPGSTPPKGRIFPLSQPESDAMKAYIDEELSKGFIRPSTSPASAGFFFVRKKDGGLRPCIDYRSLNEV